MVRWVVLAATLGVVAAVLLLVEDSVKGPTVVTFAPGTGLHLADIVVLAVAAAVVVMVARRRGA